ncbi:MAG TPA: histidine kinase, partial [Agromyces sp.]
AVVLIALVPTLLWRRTRPLLMLVIAFGTGAVVAVATGGDPQFVATAYMLLLVYAAFRWGDGRARIVGAALLVASTTLSLAFGPMTLTDLIGGTAVLVATISLGAGFRWRAGSRARELDRVKLDEREQLARDLHDTVAHHVSAIAIQAQAGTALAPTDPAAAVAALRTIEGEASRTLAEMRSIVRVLRRADAAELAPGPGLDDLSGLASTDAATDASSGPPRVEVRVTGDVASVPPPIGAAVYRMAQESVTNARRHARGATRVEVLVQVDDAGIRLDVHDDGVAAASASPGFGIVGMVERATLLGGTCSAGPAHDGGWTVSAALPNSGWST